jgi:hypothetical protein
MSCSGRPGRVDYIAPPRPLNGKRVRAASRKRATEIDCFDASKRRSDAFVIIQVGGKDLGATESQIRTGIWVPNNGTQLVTIFQSQLCNGAASLAAGTDYGDLHA